MRFGSSALLLHADQEKLRWSGTTVRPASEAEWTSLVEDVVTMTALIAGDRPLVRRAILRSLLPVDHPI
jgi:hypothetical protein